MAPIFSRKSLPFLLLGVFALLFGLASSTIATTHLCSQAAGSGWRNTDITCSIRYLDSGGSNLLNECKYRLISGTDAPGAWKDAGDCGNQSSVDLPINITVGDAKDCNDNGAANCELQYKATDNAGISNTGPVKDFDIDYSPPSGGSISYTDGFTVSTSVTLTASDGTDSPGSGINTATRTVQRKSAVLSGGTCGTYGSFATVSVTGTYPSFTNSGLASDTCYQFQYLVSDNAGNKSTYTSSNEVKVDTKFPRLDTFSADRTVLNIANPAVVISFSPPVPEDFGGSGIAQVELWRKKPGGSWVQYGTPDTPPLGSSFSDTPTDGDGTYEYGIHIVDNAGHCITEGGKDCVPPNPDPQDGIVRTVFSPIQVQVDKTAPPKPTCTNKDGTTAGGTFQNKAKDVTCSDTESGVTIRYTLDGTAPVPSSTLYAGKFDITSSATLTVAAWDTAGNRSENIIPTSPDNSYVFTILHNQAPKIDSNCNGNPGCDSPDPIKANASIGFSVSWNDPDAGDQTKLHICKTNAISGTQTCTGGSWFDSASFSTTSPAVGTYTTQAADAGTKTYYAFVCDDENACSSSKSGTFLVDTQAPTITTFTITPDSSVSPNWANNASPSITVTWNVSDQGGSHLDRVRAYRAPFGVNCNDTSKSGCVWTQAGSDAIAPQNSDNWNCGATCSSRIVDSPGSGTWWYGMHVLDKAQNETAEPNPPGPKKALVDTQNPSTAVTSPAAATWFKDNFNATFDDSDTGGSGLVAGASGCQYRFIGDNPSGADISSGDLTRQCDPVTKNITVGASPDVCRFEGANRCRVETQSFDAAGNASGWQTVLYGVDFTIPIIGSPAPSSAQSGVSTNYSATLRDPVGKVTGCGFYWRAVGSGTWNTGAATIINPIPCENNANCTVSVGHTFASAGSYETQFGCTDQATNTGWGGVTTVQVQSLSVDLSAVPASGATNTLFDLVGTVSGTMTGNINYKFDCTNNGTWELEVNNSATNPYAAVDLCQYASPGTYIAKVFVQRGVGTAEDTVSIVVSSNSIPTTTNRSVDPPSSVDYCGVTGYPPVRVAWTFSDADPGDTQGAYELEVFHGGDKVVDTGKKSGTTQSYVFQSAGEQLLWNRTYTWQVRVWDSPNDDVSTFASGPQFTTPSHYYPVPSFTWSPAFPGAEELVQFGDQTNFAPGSSSKTWSWTFGDGGSSSAQNPTHTYVQTGAFGVTLQSGDDVGSCSNLQTVNVSVPFPEWQEISPF